MIVTALSRVAESVETTFSLAAESTESALSRAAESTEPESRRGVVVVSCARAELAATASEIITEKAMETRSDNNLKCTSPPWTVNGSNARRQEANPFGWRSAAAAKCEHRRAAFATRRLATSDFES